MILNNSDKFQFLSFLPSSVHLIYFFCPVHSNAAYQHHHHINIKQAEQFVDNNPIQSNSIPQITLLLLWITIPPPVPVPVIPLKLKKFKPKLCPRNLPTNVSSPNASIASPKSSAAAATAPTPTAASTVFRRATPAKIFPIAGRRAMRGTRTSCWMGSVWLTSSK